ncbi:hypothetical protein PoB_005840200 [Plakobranchus ocellatus]|uniref:Uncharacterized protein n=1 Tax=Plakobranchus ocellatus TaxID=259542 RepID=A0AAV4CK38_9GAST|nr:hypothetical protein PoB_005840200 [Plakobranchus ocellatus]
MGRLDKQAGKRRKTLTSDQGCIVLGWVVIEDNDHDIDDDDDDDDDDHDDDEDDDDDHHHDHDVMSW